MAPTWLLLLGTLTGVDLALGHVKQVRYRSCPEGLKCRPLERCTELTLKLEEATAHADATDLLQRSFCGLNSGNVAVCCKRTSNAPSWNRYNEDIEVLVHKDDPRLKPKPSPTRNPSQRRHSGDRRSQPDGSNQQPGSDKPRQRRRKPTPTPVHRDAEQLSRDAQSGRRQPPHDERRRPDRPRKQKPSSGENNSDVGLLPGGRKRPGKAAAPKATEWQSSDAQAHASATTPKTTGWRKPNPEVISDSHAHDAVALIGKALVG